MIPIFDSLAHPTLSGGWRGRNLDASFEYLQESMRVASFKGACAIGMAGVEGYQHEAFIDMCSDYDNLVPVAGVNPREVESVAKELDHIRNLGYRAIKLHPRYSKLTLELGRFDEVLMAAGEAKLPVFFCTYMHGPLSDYPVHDPFYSIVGLLKKCSGTNVILVHGGDIDLLRYAELVRFNPNLLLDLSLTIMKYEGSSIDHDIRFLFRQFDQRICIGSDHPEYRLSDVRRRFEELSVDVSTEKLRNIAHLNLERFLGIDPAS